MVSVSERALMGPVVCISTAAQDTARQRLPLPRPPAVRLTVRRNCGRAIYRLGARFLRGVGATA
jgi:hypothetical protein